MVTIGKKIQELRKTQHVTQEALGNAVGVSTQAVSKWECGGTPDVELLPAIADFFHVSIDYLFGRNLAEETSLSMYVYQQIHKLPLKKRPMEAYHLMYSLMNACNGYDEISMVMQTEKMQMYHKKEMNFQYEMANDHVISLMSLMDHFPYFIFMPEPEEGYKDMLMKREEYEELFAFLAKEHRFHILYELYQRKKGFTVELLVKQCHIPRNDVVQILKEFMERNWIIKVEVETDESDLAVYVLNENFAFLGMLIFAKELNKKTTTGYTIVLREKPILSDHKIKR